jgi:hypothetical protein
MINDAWGACVAAAVAATGVKDTVPYPELFVNVTAAVLSPLYAGFTRQPPATGGRTSVNAFLDSGKPWG